MLSLAQVQVIVAQNIRNTVTSNQKYSPSKTFERMGIANPVSFHGFVDSVYHNPAIGLPFYNHTLPIDAFDALSQTSTCSEAQDILRTAQEISSVKRNPIF